MIEAQIRLPGRRDLRFWLHMVPVTFLVIAPMCALGWWPGVITVCICIIALQAIHGLYDDDIRVWRDIFAKREPSP